MSDSIPFVKMSGAGNDFIIIDNRNGQIPLEDLTSFIIAACCRRLSVGADGMILIDHSERGDFKWHFYNSDGSRAEMCGNGARCAARYAHLNGIADSSMSFETDVGMVGAEVVGERVKIRMTDARDLETGKEIQLEESRVAVGFVNTGVPHVVLQVNDLAGMDVVAVGRELRHHPAFSPSGTNANFVCPNGDGLVIRTYERGVEDETLACGTGAVAAALIAAAESHRVSPVDVFPKGGSTLTVYFHRSNLGFSDIYLEGDARLIYSGNLHADAWKYDPPNSCG